MIGKVFGYSCKQCPIIHRRCILVIILLTTVGLSLLWSGCTNRWTEAQQLNTIEAYEQFLRDVPDSRYRTEAKSRIENLTWQQTQQANTIEAYNRFLQAYPQSLKREDALRRREDLDWKHTTEVNSLDAYKLFLQKYPKGPHASEASTAKARIEQELDRVKQELDRERIPLFRDCMSKCGDLVYTRIGALLTTDFPENECTRKCKADYPGYMCSYYLKTGKLAECKRCGEKTGGGGREVQMFPISC